jgi:TPR repeat protein
MSEARPLLGPPPGGDRRRGPLAVARQLYRADPVWRGAVDIVLIGGFITILTFGFPIQFPDFHHAPSDLAPPTPFHAPGSQPPTAAVPAPPLSAGRALRNLTDYDRYELRHLVWIGHPEPDRATRLTDAWTAVLKRDTDTARAMVETDANVGDANSEVALAAAIMTESNLPKRFTDAEPWLHKSADQGQPMAMYWLAVNGIQGFGAHPVPVETAIGLLRQAEALGYSEASDQLCRLYIEGKGVKADPAEAFVHCRRGADLGNASAMDRLGYCYVTGTGVTRDLAAAFQWMSKAAATGLPVGERNLGVAYLLGIGTAADPGRAIEWLSKSAEHGWLDSFIRLGVIYRDGQAGAVDLPKATTWFRKAALKGSAEGQYLYAVALEQGHGTNADKVQAYVYYSLAAVQGYAAAETRLARLKGQLSSEELERATRITEATRTIKSTE